MRIIVTIIALLFVSWQPKEPYYYGGRKINDSCIVFENKNNTYDTVCFSGGRIYDPPIRIFPNDIWCFVSTKEIANTIFKQ